MMIEGLAIIWALIKSIAAASCVIAGIYIAFKNKDFQQATFLLVLSLCLTIGNDA